MIRISNRSSSLLVSFLLAVVLLFYTSGVLALSSEQKEIYDRGIYYFDIAQSYLCGTNLSGRDNAEKIWNFLTEKSLTSEQAAGIIGNLTIESGLNPGIEEATTNVNKGYGIAQWTGGRRTSLENYAASLQIKSNDLSVQLNYLWIELSGGNAELGINDEGASLTDLKNQTTVDGAVQSFMNKFERPNQQYAHLEKRLQAANDIFNVLGSTTGATSSSSSITTSNGDPAACSGGGAGFVVGGYSLPVDKSFYDSNKDWFTKPHHDYPAADIPVPENTPVYSITNGTVVKPIGNSSSDECGFAVSIQAAGEDNVTIHYCHGAAGGRQVREGDTVAAGQLIMYSGNTGNSTGPHLHVGISVGAYFSKSALRCPQTLFTGIVEGSIPALASLPSSGCSY